MSQKLDEIKISQAIIDAYFRKLSSALDVDVAIVGAGPAGLVCGYYLARHKKKVVLFERKLSVGGGMWGGGIMFNVIVVQEQARQILKEIGIDTLPYAEGYYVADAVEAVSTLCSKAVKAGLQVFNLFSAEDVLIRRDRVCGLVLNWTAVEMAQLHVDPITMRAKFVVDATGHPAEIVKVVARKADIKLNLPAKGIEGEKAMWAERAEKEILRNSRQVCPGLYVCGMSANAVFGSPRMGPIFGGMLLSGKKVAEEIMRQL